jgi:hypothetical protein
MEYILEPKEKALVSLAKDEDFVAGFMNMQALLHIEGLWVDSDYRGKVDFRMLVKRMTDALPKGMDYFAFAPTSEIGTICKYVHMEQMPWGVYRGRT